MKKQIITLMIFAIALCGVAAVVLLNHLEGAKNTFETDLRIERNGVTTEKLEVTDLALIPGSQTEYTVNMTCRIGGTYDLTLTFEEQKESPLKDYVVIELVHDGEILETAWLKDVLAGEPLSSQCYLSEDVSSRLVVRFRMPEEVGDEAKGLDAAFDVNLKIAMNMETK